MPKETITLEAIPAAIGWSIVARQNGSTYLVAIGLAEPSAKLRFWNRNIHVIREALLRAGEKGKE
jgi:hypothetical protein